MAKKKRNRKPSDLPEASPAGPESSLPQEVDNAPVQAKQPEQVEPAQPELPAAGSESGPPQEVDNAPAQAEQPEQVESVQPEVPAAEPEPARGVVATSLEERIADIRHSLVEEEAREAKKPHIVRWLKNKLKDAEELSQARQRAKEEAAEAGKETEVPQSLAEKNAAEETPVAPAAAEVEPESAQPEQKEATTEPEIPPALASLLEKIEEESKSELQAEGPAAEPVKTEEKPSFAEVKQKLAARKEEPEDFQKIRDVALQDYVEPAPARKVRQFTSPLEYFKNLILGLTKFEKRLIVGALAAILLIIVFAYGFSWLKPQPNPSATATAKASLPYPIMVTLPGGWTFSLNRGYVQNGVWNPPAGAEWLDGTEICRVVSLPWSLQLESVIRTLKAEDPVELVMSNSDRITYRVQSIKSVAADDWDTQCKNVPSLLLILADNKSDKRWVVTAVP